MRTQGVVAFAVAGLLALAAPAAAQAPTGGGWSVSFDVGLDSNLSGELYNRAQGNTLGQPVQISARTYGQAYGPGIAWSVAVGRSLGDRSEFRVRVGGNNASGERTQTGRVGTGDITGTLFSEPDKLMEVGVDVGLRQYFGGGSVQPYLGGQVGFTRVSGISVSFDVPDAIFPFETNLNLYQDSSALTAGVSGGFMFNRSETFGVYVNLDARFRGKLKAGDAGLAGTGLELINNDSTRWSTPLSVGVRLRF